MRYPQSAAPVRRMIQHSGREGVCAEARMVGGAQQHPLLLEQHQMALELEHFLGDGIHIPIQ